MQRYVRVDEADRIKILRTVQSLLVKLICTNERQFLTSSSSCAIASFIKDVDAVHIFTSSSYVIRHNKLFCQLGFAVSRVNILHELSLYTLRISSMLKKTYLTVTCIICMCKHILRVCVSVCVSALNLRSINRGNLEH